MVENARDFIFLLDETGTFISANTAAARAFGIPAAGIARKSLSDLFAPDDAAALLTQVRDVVDSRKSSEVKSAVRIKDRIYWLSTHFVPVFGEDGRTVDRVLVMARDITERQRIEEQTVSNGKTGFPGHPLSRGGPRD